MAREVNFYNNIWLKLIKLDTLVCVCVCKKVFSQIYLILINGKIR